MRKEDTASPVSAGPAPLTREAEARVVREHAPLVLHTLRPYAHRPDFPDLVAEGLIGLLSAVRRFDPNRGTRFSTFAVWRIRSALSHALTTENRECRNVKNEAMSLDAPVGDETFGAFIADPHSSDDFEEIEVHMQVEKFLSILSPREVRILRALANGELYRDIARREGVTETRIQQIRIRALRKIRKYFGIVVGDIQN